MRVIQVNVVYRRGSTGKIVSDLHHELLKHDIESIVCYGRGPKVHEPMVYKTSSEILAKYNAFRARLTGWQYNGSLVATRKLISIIMDEQPDIVHLHCINGYFVNLYRLFAFLKAKKIKTVLTLHAEFMHTGSCGHAFDCNKWLTGCGNCPQLWEATQSYCFDRTHKAWEKMIKAFAGFDTIKIVAVSRWLKDRAQRSPILAGQEIDVIENGIDTEDTFHPVDFQYLQEKYCLNSEKVLLHVTAKFSLELDDIKGGRHLVELAERLIDKNIKIMVIGGRDRSLSLPRNMINVGRVNNQEELAAYYSMASLTVLTSKRETFSMPCAESLACGTPVVGFNAGGPETIALQDYSEFVKYGDIDQLEQAVYRWLDFKSSHSEEIVKKSTDYYSREKMYGAYRKLYEVSESNSRGNNS